MPSREAPTIRTPTITHSSTPRFLPLSTKKHDTPLLPLTHTPLLQRRRSGHAHPSSSACDAARANPHAARDTLWPPPSTGPGLEPSSAAMLLSAPPAASAAHIKRSAGAHCNTHPPPRSASPLGLTTAHDNPPPPWTATSTLDFVVQGQHPHGRSYYTTRPLLRASRLPCRRFGRRRGTPGRHRRCPTVRPVVFLGGGG